MPNTREKLIELIVQGNIMAFGRSESFAEIIADHLIANGVTVQKWIPVTERLPEKGTGKVLVVKQFRGKPYIDIGEIIEGKAYCYTDDYAINLAEHKLTHWMPLPEPPKGE